MSSTLVSSPVSVERFQYRVGDKVSIYEINELHEKGYTTAPISDPTKAVTINGRSYRYKITSLPPILTFLNGVNPNA